MRQSSHEALIQALSFLIAMTLMLLPLPRQVMLVWPEFLSLVLVYWVIVRPDAIGPVIAWTIGLSFDLIGGAYLGQHALSLSVVAFLANLLRQRLRLFPLWQQAMSVLVVVGFGQLTLLSAHWGLVNRSVSPLFWLSSLSSVLVWPVVYWCLHQYRKRTGLEVTT